MMRTWTTQAALTLALAGAITTGSTAGAAELVLDSAPSQKAVVNPRISSDLQALLSAARAKSGPGLKALAGARAEERYTPILQVRDAAAAQQIQVYVWLEQWSDAVVEALKAAGAEVEAVDESRNLVQAWVAVDQVEALAALPGVRQLRRPSYGIPTLGSIRSTGDAALGSNLVRSLGQLNGNGVRVGVISAGLFNSFFRVAIVNGGGNRDERVRSGDIPADNSSPNGATFRRFGSVEVSPTTFDAHDVSRYGQEASAIPEGASLLETIFDIAPGAGFTDANNIRTSAYYIGAQTDVELANARQVLANRGVNVILDNMVFYDSGRFDGTSAISRGAQSLALTRNIVYVNSVGSYKPPVAGSTALTADRFPLFVNGYFSPLSGVGVAKFHDFNSGRPSGERDEILQVFPVAGRFNGQSVNVVEAILVWDDVWDDKAPRATNDFDLYLVDVDNPDIRSARAASVDIQSGSGLPIERLVYYASDTSENLGLAIHRKDSSSNPRTLFSLVLVQGGVPSVDTRYLTHAIPLNNADALPPVLTVGGLDPVLNDRPESSTVPGVEPGPGRAARNDFVRWYTNQSAPAIVSYTNTLTVSHRVSGPAGDEQTPFTGSSAAAAHVAGYVTLLRSAFPEIPSYEFYDILRDTAPVASGFPNATEVNGGGLAAYVNSPSFRRVNGLDTYLNLVAARSAGLSKVQLQIPTFDDAYPWEASSAAGIPPFDPAETAITPQGLRLSPGGRSNVFGFWQTPLLQFPDGDGGTRTALRTDRLYAITARVGTDESDPARVPVFRLRTLTGGGDEAANLWVSSVTPAAANAPRSLGGESYTLYYRPTTKQVAEKGMLFAFDLIHSGMPDKNANASIYLQDLTVQELPLP